MNNLSWKESQDHYGSSPLWCVCEKLPRSILHIAPTAELWCDVCGRRRRPRASISSSSDEEERDDDNPRRQMQAGRRYANDARQGSVRVPVAMSAKRPNARRNIKCIKCSNNPRPPKKMTMMQPIKLSNNNNHKLYPGRFGHFRKPQRVGNKRKDDDDATDDLSPPIEITPSMVAASRMPPPSSSSSVRTCTVKATATVTESLAKKPSDGMPNLVAFAHEVFNRPLHLRQRQANNNDNLFVSDFIPLEKPITDSTGGAISKCRKLYGRPHRSRPLPPLSQVLTDILAKQKVRAKGGGLPPKNIGVVGHNTASQFPPFDTYEGPSEDALVVDDALRMLRQPNALNIIQRDDLPTSRLSSFESEPSSDCSLSSPFEMASAPPADRQSHNYTVGAPLRLHEMMKAVAQSGMSDSSASSSSSSSSSHKSGSSTVPVRQSSVRSCGGEEGFIAEKPPAGESGETLPYVMMERLFWLMEHKPDDEKKQTDPNTKKADVQIENNHADSVKGLLQFMDCLKINKVENGNEVKTNAETQQLEIDQYSNVMSNELNIDSTNKAANDVQYINVLSSNVTKQCRKTCARLRSQMVPPIKILKENCSSTDSSGSVWTIISALFTSRSTSVSSSAKTTLHPNKMGPLNSTETTSYGSVGRPNTNYQSCQGKKKSFIPVVKPNLPNCQKCGLKRFNGAAMPRNIVQHESTCSYQHSTFESTTSQVTTSTTSTSQKSETSDPIEVPQIQIKAEVTCSFQSKVHGKTEHQTATSSNYFESCLADQELPSTVKTSINYCNAATQVEIDLSTVQEYPKKSNEMVSNLPIKSMDKCSIQTQVDEMTEHSTAESSTYSESVLGTHALDLPIAEDSSNTEPKVETDSSTFKHYEKTIEMVHYISCGLVQPKMAYAYTRSTLQGQLHSFSLDLPSPTNCSNLLEFRTPDVKRTAVSSDSVGFPSSDYIETSIEDSKGMETPIAHSATCDESLTEVTNKNVKSKKLKTAAKHKKRHLNSKQVKNQIKEELINWKNKKLLKIRKMWKDASEPWIMDQMIKKQIQEMMNKPIKLLH